MATQGRLVPRLKLASSDTALEANLDEDLGRHRFASPSIPKFKPLQKMSDGFPEIADLDGLHQSPNNAHSTFASTYEPPNRPKGKPKPMDNRDHGDVPVEDDEDARATKGLRKSAGKFPSFFAQQASLSMNKLKPVLTSIYKHELFGQAVDALQDQTYQLGIETGLEMGRDGVKRLKKKDLKQFQPPPPFGVLKRASAHVDHIPGGQADENQPEDFNKKELAKGTRHEGEHTDSPDIAEEIAMDHLKEDPHYYEHLDRVEKMAFALHGHTEFQKLRIAVENRKGSVRKGVDKDGTPWRTEMRHHYGYIKGTKGADGEEVDAYLGPDDSAEHAYVVHQSDPETGAYDEDKVMLGFSSKKDAKEAFLAHYDDPKFLGQIKEVPMDRLTELLASKKRLTKIAGRSDR